MSTSTFLVAGIAVGALLAGRLLGRLTRRPHALFLVLLGALCSLIPGLPQVHLDPSVVFLVILPPLVYRAGFVSSPREMWSHATEIGLSALGLVLATTFAVAAVAHAAWPAFGWAPAVVLGAVVAPTDPVAATTVLSRLGARSAITTILEGEGLVNDGIALTLLGVGLAAISSRTSAPGALLDFVKVAAGGSAFGLAVGLVMSRLRHPWRDNRVDLVLSLITPYLSYVGANALGLSGILSAVATGLYVGRAALSGLEPAIRLQAESFWDQATFLLESWLFVLLGLQFRFAAASVAHYPAGVVAAITAGTVGAVLLTRLLWEFLLPSLRWRPEGRLLDTGPLSTGERVVLGWSGLRGAISFAAALSVPAVVAGHPFPGRPLVLFATFCVIAATLLLQGATLPWVVRRCHVERSEEERRQLLVARRCSLEAALRRLSELAEAESLPEATVELLSRLYEQRLERTVAELEDRLDDQGPSVRTVTAELLGARRAALVKLHAEGRIDHGAFREALHDLDLEFESNRRP